jgi:hypothetical protein
MRVHGSQLHPAGPAIGEQEGAADERIVAEAMAWASTPRDANAIVAAASPARPETWQGNRRRRTSGKSPLDRRSR